MRIKLINGNFESVVEHPGEEDLKQLRAFFDARIGIDFDKPDVELLVDDVVVTENLEAVLALVRVQLPLSLKIQLNNIAIKLTEAIAIAA